MREFWQIADPDSMGFLKPCYYDYSLHKCADGELWFLGGIQNGKMGLLNDSTWLRASEQSETLMLGPLINIVWSRVNVPFSIAERFKDGNRIKLWRKNGLRSNLSKE